MNYMALYGPRLVENGYSFLPIIPGTKTPGRFTCGAWRPYPGWTRHCYRATTEHELAIWAEWPDAGVGLACGAIVGVDLDEMDGMQAHELEQRARAALGDTPAVRVGRWPKRMLLYRTLEPFDSITDPLEVLCLGRQLVAFADHPDTGRPYQWPDRSPADLPLAELPVVDLHAVDAFLGARPRRLPSAADDHQSHDATGGLSGTHEAVADALRFVPNADLSYGEWVRIGMAIKGALGEDGRELFETWSATSTKDVPPTTADAWSRFRPTRIGAGTIYHRARAAGWTPDASLVLDGSVMAGCHPAQALLDKLSIQGTRI
jgi:hypothetical protein